MPKSKKDSPFKGFIKTAFGVMLDEHRWRKANRSLATLDLSTDYLIGLLKKVNRDGVSITIERADGFKLTIRADTPPTIHAKSLTGIDEDAITYNRQFR